ncbi:cytochrome P450 [Dactylonectria macrodidyma]|uniref:Cytochrome P450 n=1 Tax=Dactylonectria macrodidyma TaxID=307937 RepID=A0A9P9ILA1_9HYPO|nr:cytochrome P450 [Dactylonectria macrodidyma]
MIMIQLASFLFVVALMADLVNVRLGWESWVFVYGPDAVLELFERQSAYTSGRPPQPVTCDVFSGENRLLLLTYGLRWRKMRSIVHILLSIYGLRVPVWDCETAKEIYTVLNEFSITAEPGTYSADLFPPLGRLPQRLQWWRPAATRACNRHTAIFMKYWNTSREKLERVTEVEACWAAGSMIEAGSETTSSALNSSILHLAAHQEVQERANEELSRVVGDERSPTFDDEEALPDILAMGKEILRIRPVTTIGTPHFTASDVFYKDYSIPKNTVVCMSQYVLHFNPEQWDNPREFDPSRCLSYPHKAGVYAAGGDAVQRDHYDFGAGRRIYRAPLGADGNPLAMDPSDVAYEDGVNTVPKPFKARFLPRSKARMKVLRALNGAQAQKDGFFLGSAKVTTDGVVVAA